MGRKESKEKSIREWQEFLDRLAIASKLGITVSELKNRLVTRNLDERMNKPEESK